MAEQDSGPARKVPEPIHDSLNADIFIATEDIGTVDRTIKPMPDWARIAMGLPPRGQKPPKSEPPANKPPDSESPKDNPPA